jgi:hypothetical protein
MAEKEEKGKLMLRCPRCENELPVNAKFCNHCGLSQTNPILVAIPQGQKDLPTRNSNLSEEQIPTTPPIAQVNDTPATAKLEAIHPVKTPQTKCGTTSHTRTLSLKARFTQNAAPAYIGKVVSVDRKPFRRNLLLTRAGLYITLVILTCLVIGIGFAIAYTIFHQTH